MSHTSAATICHTNKLSGSNQENIYIQGLYRQPQEYSTVFAKKATSHNDVQVFCVFSAQGPDNIAATTLQSVIAKFHSITQAQMHSANSDFEVYAESCARELNEVVVTSATQNGATIKMSMTALVVFGDVVRIFHIGNTKAFLYRKGRLIALTEDHTIAHRYVQMGSVPKDLEINHPERNDLTQYLGKSQQDGQVTPDLKINFKLMQGDEIYLFGTGISHNLLPAEMTAIVSEDFAIEKKTLKLIELAQEKQAKYGLTIVSISFEVVSPFVGLPIAYADNNISEKSATSDTISAKGDDELMARKRKNRILRNIFIPIIILLVTFGIGRLGMMILFNIGKIDKDNQPTITGTVDESEVFFMVMYSTQDNNAVFASSALESQILYNLMRGEAVTILEFNEYFCKVALDNGIEGFVVTSYLSELDPTIDEFQPELEADPTPIPQTEATTSPPATQATTVEETLPSDTEPTEETTTASTESSESEETTSETLPSETEPTEETTTEAKETTASTEPTTEATTEATTTATTEATTEATTVAP